MCSRTAVRSKAATMASGPSVREVTTDLNNGPRGLVHHLVDVPLGGQEWGEERDHVYGHETLGLADHVARRTTEESLATGDVNDLPAYATLVRGGFPALLVFSQLEA